MLKIIEEVEKESLLRNFDVQKEYNFNIPKKIYQTSHPIYQELKSKKYTTFSKISILHTIC